MPFGLRAPDIVGIFTDTTLGGPDIVAPTMTIAELTGARRTIVLRGRALPYRPVAWSSNMRVKTTWYQGNPVATQQVIGPDLDPTVMEGMWKDRFMIGAESGQKGSAILVNGSPNEVRNAEEAVALFYDLLRSGNKLIVVWGQEVREGILTHFEAKYDRPQDVGWRAEFDWSSRGEVVRRARGEPTGSDDLLGSMNNLDDILGFSPEDVAKQFNAQLLDSVESVRESTGILFELLRAANTTVGTPRAVVGGTSAAVNSIRLEITDEIARLVESSVAIATNVTRASSLLLVEGFRRTAARRAACLRLIALEIDRQMKLRAAPHVVQVVPVPERTSLYTLSNRYYGSPDFANFLARANNLNSALVPAGFQLRIPPKPAAGDPEAGDSVKPSVCI